MSDLPGYVASAKPVPLSKRAPWYKTIAPTYAGVMLWFVFWSDLVKGSGTPGGVLSAGLGVALLSLVIAAMICYLLFYLAPGMLGMKTGLPLYVVGTSTYGVIGGLIMPGLLMGLLQFGWLAVNGLNTSKVLCRCLQGTDVTSPSVLHGAIATVFVFLAAFVGLKGIQYVARVATWLPLIPLALIVILLVKSGSGIGGFAPDKVIAPPQTATAATVAGSSVPLGVWGVLMVMCAYVVGFFATAGAAGTDIASVARDEKDVHLGGLGGIAITTIIAGGGALLIMAGIYGGYQPGAENNLITADHLNITKFGPVDILSDALGAGFANIVMIGLAIASFPGACFSSLIAANSFKTTMPKVNPNISVGIGAIVAAVLAVTWWVESAISVFVVIGASFGPICGAMLADYLLAGRKWSGPRAGFNPAGWISWFVGFIVGAFNLVLEKAVLPSHPDLIAWKDFVPCPPVAAFIVGFVLYALLMQIGVTTRKLEMPPHPAE